MTYEEYLEVIKSKAAIVIGKTHTMSYTWRLPQAFVPLLIRRLPDNNLDFIRIPAMSVDVYGNKVPVVGIGAIFKGNETVTDIVLPSSIREIGRRAFSGCRNLARITIPKRVTYIDEDTFKDCDNLTDVYYEGSQEEWAKMKIECSKHETEFGNLIPGTPVLETKSDRLVHLPGNDPLFRATIHFNCKFDYDESMEKGMNELCKGIFWITDIANLNSEELIFRIPVTPEGEIIEPEKLDLNSKNEDNYNHRLHWASLPPKMTHNKAFDYYPRGRVEIRNKKAIIYLNPNIATDQVKGFIIEKFGLISENGIKRVTMHPDGSNHYKCHLD